MTEQQLIRDYIAEIKAKGGSYPYVMDDPLSMQIAKLQDVWRKL